VNNFLYINDISLVFESLKQNTFTFRDKISLTHCVKINLNPIIVESIFFIYK